MAGMEKSYTKGTCYHGYAGIASAFVALADRMVRKDGTVALVLPMTALAGHELAEGTPAHSRKLL